MVPRGLTGLARIPNNWGNDTPVMSMFHGEAVNINIEDFVIIDRSFLGQTAGARQAGLTAVSRKVPKKLKNLAKRNINPHRDLGPPSG
jgi:hypothetical protein